MSEVTNSAPSIHTIKEREEITRDKDGNVFLSIQKSLIASVGTRPLSISFSANGKFFAVAGGGGSISLWHVEKRRKAWQIQLNDSVTTTATAFGSIDNEQLLVTASNNGVVYVWDTHEKEMVAKFNHGFAVHSVEFSLGIVLVASAEWGGKIVLWDVSNKSIITTRKSKGPIRAVGFPPSGALLASGNQDGTVRVCDAMTYEGILEFRGHKNSVETVEFSPDGKILASGGRDSAIYLWSERQVKQLLYYVMLIE